MKEDSKKLGVLVVAYEISTSTEKLDAFRSDCRGYLAKHGIEPADPAYGLFADVSRGRRMIWPKCLELVNLILEQTGSVGRGPSDALFDNDVNGVSMPFISSFYKKYVEGQELAWVERKCIASEMRAELCGASPSW